MVDKESCSNLCVAREMIEKAWENILKALQIGYGLDINNENFIGTPERISRSLMERCLGINSENLCKEILKKSFPSNYRGMIVVDPITVNSLCPHHFEDVSYLVRVGYIPKERCVGLSKLSRVIKLLGSAPILQEDYTTKCADIIYEGLDAEGVCVVTHGRHNCMVARGVKQPGSLVTMSEVRGSFLTDPSVKEEFYQICGLAKETKV